MRVSLQREPAMVVNKEAIGKDKLVYLVVADKKIKYPTGRSRIVYIGNTKNGANRIAQSAATRADEILGIHGVKKLKLEWHPVSQGKR